MNNKKLLSIFISFVLLICSLSNFAISANAYSGVVEKNGVMQMGDFDSVSHGYIIFYPTDLQTSDTTYPVAVWANGTMCPPALYESLLAGVAKQGYIVIASSELMSKNGTGQSAAIDYIFDQSMDENSPFYGKVDPNRVGAFGHSQGGASSVNAAVADNRIGAIVSIAGASTASEAKNLSVPSLFLTGTGDAVVMSSMWVKPSYNACNCAAVYASLNKGVHTSCIITPEIYVNYIVKWFDAFLNENGDKSAFTNGGELSKDSQWKDYTSKNLNNKLAGSIISDGGSIWIIVAMLELVIIVGGQVYIFKKKRDYKNTK